MVAFVRFSVPVKAAVVPSMPLEAALFPPLRLMLRVGRSGAHVDRVRHR
jgi:hypothetical protein